MRYLDRVRDDKIPFYDKLPKESNFYKHYVSNLASTKFGQATVETVKNEENMLREVGESIQKVVADQKEAIRHMPYTRSPTKQEKEAGKSLWQELSA